MLAALGSFLFAGLGQVYNGQQGKGMAIFLGTLLGAIMLVVPGVIVWLYGIADAYSMAKKMNEGTIPFREHSWFQIVTFIIFCVIVLYIIYSLLMILILTMVENGEFTDLMMSY